MAKNKTGGLNSPQTSTKVGTTPTVAGNTLATDIKITQPREIKFSGTARYPPKK